jgi:hypothetical protein
MRMRALTHALIKALASATILGSSLPVCAAQTFETSFTAADLKSACEDTSSRVCTAYIAGYSQGFYYSSVSTQAGFAPCPASGFTVPRATLITTKFMSDHPEVLAQGAASVVAQALVSAFPCSGAR